MKKLLDELEAAFLKLAECQHHLEAKPEDKEKRLDCFNRVFERFCILARTMGPEARGNDR